VSVDEVGYAEWLRSLIAAGKIAPPQPYVLERMRAGLQRQIGDLADRVQAVPSLRPTLDRLSADLRAVEAELVAVGGSAITPRGPASLPVEEE
jgi:hypothetical protein